VADEVSDSRRKFLGYAITGMTGAIALGYAIPLVNYLVKPALKKTEEPWAEICSLGNLPVNEPVSIRFNANIKIAWQEERVEHDVWVIKRPGGAVTVFSPVCPHLGCGYRWDEASMHFECPCHGSVFDIDGKVLAGPAPRPLDTLPARVENDKLFVKYEKFRLGIREKIEA